MRLLKIEWSNSSDLGNILYSQGFVNRIWLDVEVERPDYNTTIESEVNGDNVEVPKFKKHEKVYKFELYATEDLVDAFQMMQLHDTITATLQTGQIISVSQLTVEHEWIEMGCLAKLTVSMMESYVVSTACNENMDVDVPCDCLNPTMAGPIDIADQGTTSGNAGDIVLFFTDEVIADCKYVGHLWQLTTTGLYDWVDLGEPLAGTCIEGPLGDKFLFDGQYWYKYPGYITQLSIVTPGMATVEIKATIIDHNFGTVQWLSMMGWTNGGDFTKDELEAGAEFDIPESGTIDVRIKVWNHSCDNGYTDTEEIIMP